jgi:hypothetical protein
MSAALFHAPKVLEQRLEALAQELSTRDDALGLLALGSVGTELTRLDAWSDLDFFVLVREGAKQRYIADLDWLAAAHPLVWHYQNTADGRKALMADGVFCEFAVFETHELRQIPYAPGRLVWRRSEVDPALACPEQPLPARHDSDWCIGEALSNLMIGLRRHARGERLAAMRMIQFHALDRVLEYLESQQPNPQVAGSARDPFNIDRRIEMRSPQAAQTLPVWAGGYERTRQAALAQLQLLEAHAVVPACVAEQIRALADLPSPPLDEDA